MESIAYRAVKDLWNQLQVLPGIVTNGYHRGDLAEHLYLVINRQIGGVRRHPVVWSLRISNYDCRPATLAQTGYKLNGVCWRLNCCYNNTTFIFHIDFLGSDFDVRLRQVVQKIG